MNIMSVLLGSQAARGLWGIKNTRKPVDIMVNNAKKLESNQTLPFVKVVVSKDSISFKPLGKKKDNTFETKFNIDVISYGVQDIIYTRVFSMIVVKDGDLKEGTPFTCHAFVCESRNQARQLTYALAAAFEEYGKECKLANGEIAEDKKKRFQIDLRTPEQYADDEEETEA